MVGIINNNKIQQMENNYSVYQHVTPDNMHYFGQTNNIKCRWSNNGAGYKGTSLYPYIEQYGWDNIQHIVLYENLPYDDALKIEDSLIISGWEKGNCINKRRSGNVSKDDVYIREYQREYQREYYEQNKDKLNQYSREYREENREKILEYQREYREENREKYNEYHHEYQREYREKNREKYNEYHREYQREYQRQRYQRKKEEKQFKEFGYIPLF